MKINLLRTAIITSALVAAIPAYADSTINIELADKAENIDFSQKLDLVVGGHGDMSKAPVVMKSDVTTVPPGKVTFAVVNHSSEIQHEMVVSPIASMDAAPVFKDAENEVDEDAAAALGEVAELDPGKTGSVTLDLKPGFYILYCNVTGHYSSGMWTKIEVK